MRQLGNQLSTAFAFASTLVFSSALAWSAPRFSVSAKVVDTFDFVEVTVRTGASAANPFTSASLTGELARGTAAAIPVDGFCDSPDGQIWRIRFMPTEPGRHQFRVRLTGAGKPAEFRGEFESRPSKRRGLLRVDPAHPAHFIWSGTGERYFWNGLTTYALMGWSDEKQIQSIIDRAARLKVNRLRVTLIGPRVPDASRWYEPVKPSAEFRFLFGPWEAAKPDQVDNPGWDVTRFNVQYWRKWERMLAYARDRDVTISVIFFLDGQDAGADPFGKANRGGEDEKRYYRYAASRFAAYSNVVWDVTNEWHLFRDAWWVERMGTYLKSVDPYQHLASCHGRGDFPWMLSDWANFAMFQMWDEGGGYEAMLQRRRTQAASGRLMPQINEEYGYEDHYPVKWGGNRRPPSRNADSRRRQAWEITMAGTYQTTGERANRGDGEAPATPGGWVNGGFDGSMKMLEGYAHMVDFFLSLPYYELDPMPELAAGKTRVLAKPGARYVLYFTQGGTGGAQLEPGRYTARWFNPKTGAWTASADVQAGAPRAMVALEAPTADQDWALLLEAK